MRSVRLILAFLVFAVAFVLPLHASDQIFDRTFPLGAGGTFTLENVNGSVSVTGWDRDAVEVYAVKSTQQQVGDLSRVRIEVAAKQGSVSVATIYPRDDGAEVNVSYRVQVPRRVLLREVATVNGTVRVSGVDATGALQSVNGSIEVLDSSGGLSARTTNGDVRMELLRLDPAGPLTATTVNGSVALALPSDAGVALNVRSLNGDFRSELPLTVEGEYNQREFRARMGDGRIPVTLRTVNGQIRVLALARGV